jgi:hypothetical protein
MQAINITTSATLIAAGGNRDFLHIYNNSDVIIYIGYDGGGAAVTTSLGVPLPPNDTLQLNNDGFRNIFNDAVYAIHGGSGNKEVRVQGV